MREYLLVVIIVVATEFWRVESVPVRPDCRGNGESNSSLVFAWI